MTRSPHRPGRPAPGDWLAAATHATAELLGGYLPLPAHAAIHGRRPDAFRSDAVRELGRRAATPGGGGRLLEWSAGPLPPEP